MLGRPTCKQVNKMCGAIAAVYAKAKTSHESFPLGSKLGFSAAILKKDTYKLETTWSLVHLIRPDTYDDTILEVHTDVS